MEGKGVLRKDDQTYAADLNSIRGARLRISPYIHQTPILTSQSINFIAGKNLFFKAECLQKGGAFKFRGACNAVFSLDDERAAKGIVTHSSGNHAAAVALAAKLRGIPAYVIIPRNAPQCKVDNARRYGGQVTWCEPTMKSRELVASKVQKETGSTLIPSSNDERIISGQGTISLELLEQVAEIDTIIAPVSEPCGADDAAKSKAAGRVITLDKVDTIADGLRASLGDLTWPVVRDLVDEVITVDDLEIISAMRLCYQVLKVAVEPSGAVGLAAVLSERFRCDNKWENSKNVGIILSGGNVDLRVLAKSFHKQIV